MVVVDVERVVAGAVVVPGVVVVGAIVVDATSVVVGASVFVDAVVVDGSVVVVGAFVDSTPVSPDTPASSPLAHPVAAMAATNSVRVAVFARWLLTPCTMIPPWVDRCSRSERS
jgi:hypothetical protein